MSTVNAKMKPSVRKLYEERLLKAQDNLATLMIARDNLQVGIEQVQDEVVALERKLQDDDVAGMTRAPYMPLGEAMAQLCKQLDAQVDAVRDALQQPTQYGFSHAIEVPTPAGMIAVPFHHMVKMLHQIHFPEDAEIPASDLPAVCQKAQTDTMIQQLNIDDSVIARHILDLLHQLGHNVSVLTPEAVCELAVNTFEGVHWKDAAEAPLAKMVVHVYGTRI